MFSSLFGAAFRVRRGAALAALALLGTPAALAYPGDAVISYRMTWSGLHIADVVDTLEFADGRYRITSTATAAGLAAALNMPGVNRFSEGVFRDDGALLCERYEHLQGDKHRKVQVDLETGEVLIGGEKPDVEGEGEGDGLVYDYLTALYGVYTKGAVDPSGKILLTNGRNLKEYEFSSDLQVAPVDTDIGKIDAVLLERKTEQDREYQAWYAPEMNLIPVRVRIRNGNSVIEFVITGYQFEESGGT